MSDEQLRKIADIADHDARVDEVRLQASGVCEIVFSHLEVARPAELRGDEEEAYEVRIHPGRLWLAGVSSFSCRGQWSKESMVMEGHVRDAEGALVPWERLLTEQAVKRVELSFASGTQVVIEAETASLRLEGEGEEFERWSGPL